MKRALVLVALVGLTASGSMNEKLPSDAAKLNAFAGAYNKYVNSMGEGVNDARLWKKVLQAWKALAE